MAAGSKFPTGMQMPSIDNLFTTEEDRQAEKLEKVQVLPLAEMHPFTDHPFEVRDDEDMDKMVDSVKTYGVMTPTIVRPRKEGGYEIVSGHRRTHAAERAGLQGIPAIVRDMDYDTAIILMVDSNVQREHILPMEKARAFQMKLEAIKRQGVRSDLTSDQVGQKLNQPYSVDKIAGESGESKSQVQRYIRLNNLIPELQAMVDEQSLKINPADAISSLTPIQQQDFYEYIDSQSCTPSLSQAQKLKSLSKTGEWSVDKLEEIMTAQPPSVAPREMQLNLSMERLSGYFPKGCTKAQMEHQIMHILESYFRQMQQIRDHTIER